MAGDSLDCANSSWDCETPYHYLNIYEKAEFSKKYEEKTKKKYLKDHNLKPWILIAKEKYKPFRECWMANKKI